MKDNVAPAPVKVGAVDIEAFAKNLARMVEEGGKALAAYLKPREEGQVQAGLSDEMTDMVKTLGEVGSYWLSDPTRAVELQSRLGRAYLDLWGAAVKRLSGEEAGPVVTPDPKDRRFADPEWSSNQFFDFVKQAYLLSTNWADHLVEGAQGPRPAHPPEGRVLRQAGRQRAVAVELRADQSGAVARDARLQRGESRARHAHAGRGHRGRRRRSENPPVGRGEIRGRPQSRGHARQGDLRKRADAAHPVRAVDADGAEDAAADRAALDQQVLRARSDAGKILHQMVRRSGAHGVRDLLGQPGREAQGQGLRGLHARGAPRRPRRDRSRRPAKTRSTPSAIASAARCCRSRWPPWRRRTTTASPRRRCLRRRSISPTPATSRCSSTRSSSRRWKSGWPSAAISKARRWPTPSTCCAPTT